jgi:acetylornithine deacetylase/succinyl-diaminopimelate desuccinylase-like protein
MKGLGVDAGWGETGFNTNERRWARPTCDVNGIYGGYMGEGPKTIIPAKATAKITCRLVPNQNPEKITSMLGDFLKYHAIKRAFVAPPVFVREGGSIPIVSTFRELLGVDTLLLGWGQNTDNLHSPNEHFNLEDFHKGTVASAALWWELSRKSSRRV